MGAAGGSPLPLSPCLPLPQGLWLSVCLPVHVALPWAPTPLRLPSALRPVGQDCCPVP